MKVLLFFYQINAALVRRLVFLLTPHLSVVVNILLSYIIESVSFQTCVWSLAAQFHSCVLLQLRCWHSESEVTLFISMLILTDDWLSVLLYGFHKEPIRGSLVFICKYLLDQTCNVMHLNSVKQLTCVFVFMMYDALP